MAVLIVLKSSKKQGDMERDANKALKQIEEKNYRNSEALLNICTLWEYGIAGFHLSSYVKQGGGGTGILNLGLGGGGSGRRPKKKFWIGHSGGGRLLSDSTITLEKHSNITGSHRRQLIPNKNLNRTVHAIQLLKHAKEKEVNIRRDAKVDLTRPLEWQVNLWQRAHFGVQTVETISELAQVDTKTLISIVRWTLAVLEAKPNQTRDGGICNSISCSPGST
jgi:hypothetical protein